MEIDNTIKILNDNQGVVSIVLFLISLIIAWFSGIFKFIRNKPNFKIELIEGPNFCVVVETGEKLQGMDANRTAISLYLSISNIGNASSSIEKVLIDYKCNVLLWENWKVWKKFSKYEEKIEQIKPFYRWFKDIHSVASLEEFKVNLGDEKLKLYPYLFQNNLFTENPDTYLVSGKSVRGILYFESNEYWGGFEPKRIKNEVDIRIKVYDIYNHEHIKKMKIPFVTIDEAKKYNTAFGETYKKLREKYD